MQCKIFVGWTLPKLEIYKQSFKTACCSNLRILGKQPWYIYMCDRKQGHLVFNCFISYSNTFYGRKNLCAFYLHIFMYLPPVWLEYPPLIFWYISDLKKMTLASVSSSTQIVLTYKIFFLVLLYQAPIKEKLFALNIYFWH